MLVSFIIIKLIINVISILLFLFSLWLCFKIEKFVRRAVWWIWKCI